MATIADKMSEIMSIRVAIRQAYNIPKSVPFRDYLDYLTWFNETPPDSRVFADFTKSQYSKDGKIVRFEDLFGFERLSEATTFDSDGLEIWGVDEPRIVRGKGLLVEPESTNFLEDSFLNTGLDGFPIKGGKAEVGKDGVGSYLKILKQESLGYWYKQYSDRESEDGSHSLSYYSDTHNITWGSSTRDLSAVGVVQPSILQEEDLGDFSIYYGYANMKSTGQQGRDRGLIKRTTHSDVEPKFYIMQLENQPFYTSPIKTGTEPTTRLPDILSLPIPRGHTIKGDWDSSLTIKVVDGKLAHEGIGYIRKLEVVPADSFEIDFIEGITKSDTGAVHEGLYSFERLSEATTFDENGLKVWGVDEPRVVSGKGLLIEPESTNFLTHSILNLLINARCTSSYADPSLQITELEGNTSTYYTYRGAPLHGDTVKITDSFYIKKPEFSGMRIGIGAADNPLSNRGQSVVFNYDSKEIIASLNSIGAGYSEAGDLTRIWGSTNKEFLYDNYLIGAACPTHPSMLEVSYLQRESLGHPSSIIPVQDTPATRLADLLTIPSGYTVSGDYDEGINVDGSQVSGFGYIRKLKLEKK